MTYYNFPQIATVPLSTVVLSNTNDEIVLISAEELENVRSHFMEKEKELAIAVARVESLTRQLDKQRKGWSQATPSRQKTHQELELERLRKELMVNAYHVIARKCAPLLLDKLQNTCFSFLDISFYLC